MPTGDILVFEAQPYWLPELQRRFAGEDQRVRGCSTSRDLLADADHAGLIVLVLDQQEAGCLEVLGKLATTGQSPPVICLASEQITDLRWPAFELGATVFLDRLTPSDELLHLCRRLSR